MSTEPETVTPRDMHWEDATFITDVIQSVLCKRNGSTSEHYSWSIEVYEVEEDETILHKQ